MKTQTTISKKQENKGARGILDLTGQLSQVLKQFEGIYTKKLPDTDGLTVESWMSAMGVERFVQTGKDGKETKKGYTPGTIKAGWNDAMQDGNMHIFRNVPAKYKPVAEDVERFGLKDFDTSLRVFTKEEAEKPDGKPISRYMLTAVPDNKWSVQTILKGLKQGKNFAKENDKSVADDLAWESIEHVYIVTYRKNSEGETVRVISEVNKDCVVF